MAKSPFPTFSHLEISSPEPRFIRVIFNRPEKLNALDGIMVEQLNQAMDFFTAHYSDSVLVFSGKDCQAFMAGADIKALKERGVKEALEGINLKLFEKIAHFPFPTVAMISGYCFGGGMELALACDLRLASFDALFSQPEVGLGIIPGAGATFRLPSLIGSGLAREMIFSGVRINAERALSIGLVNYCADLGSLYKETLKVVQRVLKQDPQAVALSKRVLGMDLNPALSQGALLAQAILFESKEKHRRMGEFLENQKDKSAKKSPPKLKTSGKKGE